MPVLKWEVTEQEEGVEEEEEDIGEHEGHSDIVNFKGVNVLCFDRQLANCMWLGVFWHRAVAQNQVQSQEILGQPAFFEIRSCFCFVYLAPLIQEGPSNELEYQLGSCAKAE